MDVSSFEKKDDGREEKGKSSLSRSCLETISILMAQNNGCRRYSEREYHKDARSKLTLGSNLITANSACEQPFAE